MNSILNILSKNGPLTGKELHNISGLEELLLWRKCNITSGIISSIFGHRYLRLDKSVKGYARLSPSIKREFLTYTVIGLEKDFSKIQFKSKSLLKRIKNISREKYSLALNTVRKLVESDEKKNIIIDGAVFIIAGDIVYEMAHGEPRPESSTGELVMGSDLDIIIVCDGLSTETMRRLDRSIYKEKFYLLHNPSYHEEIDYVLKDIKTVSNQVEFDNFQSMVACKILNEGGFLFGSKRIFEKVKGMLCENRIPEKLKEMENAALKNRKDAEQNLLIDNCMLSNEECMKLFYTVEESEEIF